MDNLTSTPVKTSWRLRLLALALVAFLLVHFGATVVYTVDDLPIDPRIQHRAAMYMKPLFHQGWKLFAPDVPTCNPVMHFRVYEDGGWSPYRSLIHGSGMPRHPKLVYTTHKLAVYLMNALRLRCDDTPDADALRQRALASGSFARCVNYAMRVHQGGYSTSADSLQLQLVLVHIPKFNTAEVTDSTVVSLPSIPFVHEGD